MIIMCIEILATHCYYFCYIKLDSCSLDGPQMFVHEIPRHISVDGNITGKHFNLYYYYYYY